MPVWPAGWGVMCVQFALCLMDHFLWSEKFCDLHMLTSKSLCLALSIDSLRKFSALNVHVHVVHVVLITPCSACTSCTISQENGQAATCRLLLVCTGPALARTCHRLSVCTEPALAIAYLNPDQIYQWLQLQQWFISNSELMTMSGR